MKHLVILGAGTAGTIMANKLRPALDEERWRITIVDQDRTHYYQPGFLFIPFGIYDRKDVVKPKKDYIPPGVEVQLCGIDRIEPASNSVRLTDGKVLPYDLLIIARDRLAGIAPDRLDAALEEAGGQVLVVS